VLMETRFASRYPDLIASNQMLAESLAANWPRSADDRITQYQWDGNGRLISETRIGVRHATVDANGRLTEGVANSTTRYVYDGEGHLLRRTDANGNQNDFMYDALGRQAGQILPQFVDHLNRQVRSRVSFEYDGLNNVVKETRHGDTDQVTTYTYGAGGRLVSKTNALGVVTNFEYDAAGNTTLVGYLRGDADGRQQRDETAIGYDAANRELSRTTRVRDPGTGAIRSDGVSREQKYNAYGEIVARRTGGGGPKGEWQEYADYNNAGWVVRTNFGDGVSRLFLYDRNGNATLKVESMETDMRRHAIETGDDLVGLLKRADMMQTYTRYDAHNQVIQVRQPKTSGGAPRVSFSPVDIPIDGGKFANTQLTISGWLPKSGSVVGPTLPLEGGDVGAIGGNAGTAQTTVDWTYRVSSDGGVYTDSAQMNSISISLPDLSRVYGAYSIEVKLKYAMTGRYMGFFGKDKFPKDFPLNMTRERTSGSISNSPSRIVIPLEDRWPGRDYPIPFRAQSMGTEHDRQFAHVEFAYTAEIFLTPMGGAGGPKLIGTIEKSALVFGRADTGGTNIFGQPIKQWAVAKREAFNGEASMGFSASMLSVARGTLPPDARGMLYYRRAGSDDCFQLLGKSANSQPNSYTVDAGALPDGDYEMIFMAVGADGTLLRRDGYTAHISRAGNSRIESSPIALNSPTARPSFMTDATGNYIWTAPRTLDMYALRSKEGVIADTVDVRFRRAGSAGYADDWRRVDRDPVSGALRLDLPALGAGDYEMEVRLHKGGTHLDTLRSQVRIPGGSGAPDISVINYLSNTRESVTFHAQPADTDHLMVSWELNGTTHYRKVERIGSEFVWDTLAEGALLPRHRPHAIKFTAYDAYGCALSMGKGTITVGSQGVSSATLEGSNLPCIFEFSPQDDRGAKLTNATTLVLYYRPAPHTQADYDKPFSEAILTRDAAGRFLFDATSLPTNAEYEYRYLAKDAQGNVLTERQSYFLTGTRNNPVTNVDIVGVIDETAKDMTIDRMQSHNAFREVSAERDGRGNWTYSSYNTMGRLTLKREPEISVTLADGSKVRVAPETRFHYDLTGNLVGIKDANGNLSTHQWNYGLAQPAVARSWDALGHDKRFVYDAQGNLRVQYDELNRRTDFTYDAGDRLIRIDRPVLANGANAGAAQCRSLRIRCSRQSDRAHRCTGRA